MITHSRLPPSNRHRWALWPGSVREEEKYPEQAQHQDAIDNTHSHTLLEYCIKNRDMIDVMGMIGRELSDNEGTFIVSSDQAERVRVAIDYICRASNDYYHKVKTRERVNPKPLLGRDDLSCIVDCHIIGPNWIEIIDFNDSVHRVEAYENMQLEQQAYGILSKYASVKSPYKYFGLNNVIMTTIQPRLRLLGLNPISQRTVSV